MEVGGEENFNDTQGAFISPLFLEGNASITLVRISAGSAAVEIHAKGCLHPPRCEERERGT